MYVLRKGKKKDKQAHQSDPGSSRHKSAGRLDIFLSGSYSMILSQWDVVFFAVAYQQVDEDHSVKPD